MLQLIPARLRRLRQDAEVAPTAERPAVSVARPVDEPRTRHTGYLLPLICAGAGAALLLVSLADAAARSGRDHGDLLFWFATLAFVAAVMAALVSDSRTRNERVALVALLGTFLYLVKVLRDPFAFTFADELVHLANANAVVDSGRLFEANSILEVTPFYPGLQTVAAAVAEVSGLDTFVAGLVVIGTARLLLIVSLFLLVEHISSSARTAGVAAAAYAANPNFLFFGAQYAYESLALPLLVLSLACLSFWRAVRARRAWGVVAVIAMSGVVVTHHMTSYALVGVLTLVALVSMILGEPRARGHWLFVLYTVTAVGWWLVVVASATVGYLSPVLTKALASTMAVISREGSTRHILESHADGGGAAAAAAAWERPVGIASVLLLAIVVPVGLRVLWRSFRQNPIALILGAAAVSYFGSLGLRVVPGAWETANRSSEFLFLGVAFAAALAVTNTRRPGVVRFVAPHWVGAAFAVVFAGGVIAGWPAHLRLSHPYRIETSASPVDPPGAVAAAWVGRFVGRGARIATDDSNARLLVAYADAHAIAGRNPDVEDILRSEPLERWMVALLARERLRYVVVDQRRLAFDPMLGYFFADTDAPPAEWSMSGRRYRKFDRQRGVSRLYDGGTIVIYDIRRLLDRAPAH